LDDGAFQITDKDGKITRVPQEINYKGIIHIGKKPTKAFKPPLMGITCLGPSHGFDPKNNTSGFILWLNHNGIMVDPPVNSTEWLINSNVNPKTISSVILTHCHADHDAGTFQKILEDEKITIYTTETIMDSFVRKYSALTGQTQKRIYELFDFHPVTLGAPTRINAAQFWFHYALHSIPSLGFYFYFQNQSFYYTSDHLNHPESFEKFKSEGILTEERYKFLMDFPWHHKIIYHEAGIPPLHTPIGYLDCLPDDIKNKITVYHIAEKDFPDTTDLRLAKFGIEHTLYPEIQPPKFQDACDVLDVLSHIDIFQNFNILKAKEFLSIIKEERYAPGDFICKKGTEGDNFYIIVRGSVRVEGIPEAKGKTYGTYEYFGETSLIINAKRNADMVADTEVIVYSISKVLFLNYIDGTDLEENFKNLAKIRKSNSWAVLTESSTFRKMTSAQKTQLEAIMVYEELPIGTVLIEQGKKFNKAFIIRDGIVEVSKNEKQVHVLLSGDFVGEISSLQKHGVSHYSFICKTDFEGYSVHHKDMSRYIQNNPRVYMNLVAFYEDNA
jgi:CRP-like cAMP-binding protein